MSESLVQLPRRSDPRPPSDDRPHRVLVCGCPNTGKTTLFNRIAGTNLRVGNYPGVTVEGSRAVVDVGGAGTLELVDLPGCYSLSGRSAEERIAIDSMLSRHGAPPVDVVLVVADATHVQSNLYLALQVAELGLPTILVLNMLDEARKLDIDLDLAGLSERLGIPVLAVSGRTGEGLDDLTARIGLVLRDPALGRSSFTTDLPSPIEATVADLAELIPEAWLPDPSDPDRVAATRRATALWALMSLESGGEDTAPESLVDRVEEHRARLAADGIDADGAIVASRYRTIDEELLPLVRLPGDDARSLTARIDSVLVHPAFGFVVFLLLMTLLFQGLFSWSDPAITLVETAVGHVASAVASVLPSGLLADFVVDGLIAGVGSVLVFLPQILLLFLLIGVMEDSGYMARVAYLMDRIMRSVGLHGRAFVPMLSGFACAVPAVLATRTMERKRDRMLTMMVVPLTLCSARLPVYTLIIAALYPVGVAWGGLPVQGLLLAGMYIFSIVTALVAAAVLGRTVLKGRNEPLILELPPYRMPRWNTVLRMVWGRSRIFLTDAGSVILVCTVILWALLTFPRLPAEQAAALPEADVATAELQASFGAHIGHAMEPVIEPLGFDWKIGVGLLGTFAAREVFVATMGVVYGVGDDVDEESATLREKIRGETWADGSPVYTPLTGLSLMVFFALACQCMSTLAAVRRETKSWRWPIFMFVYMSVLAWVCSFVVYQGGLLLGFS